MLLYLGKSTIPYLQGIRHSLDATNCQAPEALDEAGVEVLVAHADAIACGQGSAG